MQDVLVKFLIAALATWRISVAIWYEDGPFDQYKYFRLWIENNAKPEMIQGDDGEPTFVEHVFWDAIWHQLKCFWCVTFWVSLPITIIVSLPWYWWTGLIPFALSGTAMLLGGANRTIWRAGNE